MRQDGPLYGYLAEFDSVGALLAACTQVRDAGFTRWDAHTPFPVHGLDRALNQGASHVGWIAAICGLIGIALGHVLYYMAINRLGVAVTAGIIQLQPFLVGIGETFIPGFHGSLSPLQWVTGCIAILGAAVILRVQHKLSRPAPVPAPSPSPPR